ncbi:amino acid ABC transporter ATP-binding protein [Corynebacterium kutscheri]|uniref:ABC-type polar-amino-acid transporter n=1 Tax=Corynebacterium kutscheri TaxID=35755 RepID=A0A0F6QZ16_9CORY|nr:amino acid ABC transporter ATP-binding protein [Corynebacterium kutscheri]AKE40877.1 amino acid ABC transporter ATP-binding protein, PAAT family [Corynebacterium kutscheri]VEH06637.1 glutamate ABC transport system, ATP-binding protein [Corynebacterium kutscheri]VEH09174.1 glutamate ABC transport system, ATP-binding protein [Corynebacterium kutscheri]
MSLIELQSVVKRYGDNTVLDGVSLEVLAGEVVAIIGPSGCGKSTLLRCINGLEEIQAGQIIFRGEPLTKNTKWTQLRQDIGMVFQNYELFNHLTVLDNLLLAPKVVQKANKKEVTQRAHMLLARVGLAGKEKSYPRELSGGQKQRVAIVRALMMNPQVLLLDEITASLDPEIVREVLDVVLKLAKEGMTMVIVTHEMDFARAIADTVVFMDAGNIVEKGNPRTFFDHPRTQRAQRFLNTLSFDDLLDGTDTKN